MTKSIIEKMEEAMRRPVPYEGLRGRHFAPFGKAIDSPPSESRSIGDKATVVLPAHHDSESGDDDRNA
jgi:hypothetical protein